jgi:hypothetical protein
MSGGKTIAAWICTLALSAVLVTAAPANEPVRRTPFSINEPLELPGMMLEPGSYVLKLIEPETQRNVLQVFETVQLWSDDETQLLSTMLTMPNYDLPTTDKTVFDFFDRGPNQPKALRLWFAPSRNYSQEFVYPQAQAVELAKAVGRGVLSMPRELPGDIGRLAGMVVEPTRIAKKAPFVTTAPDARASWPTSSATGRQTPVGTAQPSEAAQRVRPAPEPANSSPAAQSRARSREANRLAAALPRTGSYLPVVASIGLLAVSAGAMLRMLSRRLERR